MLIGKKVDKYIIDTTNYIDPFLGLKKKVISHNT